MNLQTLPLVPLRDMVIFPSVYSPFVIGRESSIKAFEVAISKDGKIFVSAQEDAGVDHPRPEDISIVGTVAKIIRHVKLESGNIKVIVEGLQRARIIEFEAASEGYIQVVVKAIDRTEEITPEVKELADKVSSLFEKYLKLTQGVLQDVSPAELKYSNPQRMSDIIATYIPVSSQEKQNLLETVLVKDRLQYLFNLLRNELEKLRVDQKIQSRVQKQMEKAQKEYYLSEKMKAIQQELGRKDDKYNEIENIRNRIEKARMPAEALEKAMQELNRLEVMPPISAEATVSRNYLEWLIAMPWHKKSKESRDMVRAEKVLNEDHYGLEKVKERILEFLAVRKLVKKARGSILCFVGPPGVGKTSLARSIARATGRKFVRLSLGGVRDEAEIRGHRRTYIGAFPGQIVQMVRKAGTKNPVFLLDEVDKMSMDFRGDPSAALMEVLDPEQNCAFLDHYLDTPFDLSEVMFICTSNIVHTIPAALLDRMEVLRIAGYTLNEKINITQKYLIVKQLEVHGLQKIGIHFTEEGIRDIIERYTKEAGVRNLEREIASICRKVARKVISGGDDKHFEITPENLTDFLGIPRYHPRESHKESEVGTAIGLAWTEVGGEIMTTEASVMKGKGALILTGKLGDVMQESAQAALSYIRSRAEDLGIDKNFYRKYDIHIHVPEGAIPKDGPSAGITMASALASILMNSPLRSDVAMTGEITLRGKILPIGGVKEKILAAYRSGIKMIILPRDNEKDLAEIPEDIKKFLEFKLVKNMDEVLRIALEMPSALEAGFPLEEEKKNRISEDSLSQPLQ
ncbi:MAG: endopeptidase La [Acidobacteriota bacterium]